MARRLLLLLGLLAGGCRHVTKADDWSPASQDAAAPASSDDSANWHTSGASAKPESERAAAGPGRPQLASSPEGLMVPEGPGLIQEALAKKGYLSSYETGALDARTRNALQKFQNDQGLPSTGAPDHETLRKLGLDPAKVFRAPSG